MSKDTWIAVDQYLVGRMLPPDPALEAALKASDAAGLPPISVSATNGKLLHLLARIAGARRILEIGTLGGYSTIWMARALPADGRLVTLEADEKHAAVARANIARAELDDLVEIRVGRALDTLPALEAEGREPFDLIFIDADKAGTPDYFRWSLRLSRPGTTIIVDNVIRDGAIIEDGSSDGSVQGMRRFFDLVAAEPRVSATALQTVGFKGYDGFAIAVVNGPS